MDWATTLLAIISILAVVPTMFLILWALRAHSLEVRRSVREPNDTPPSGAEIKKRGTLRQHPLDTFITPPSHAP